MNVRTYRALAGFGVICTALGVCYAVALAVGWPQPQWGQSAQVVLHLGELAVLLALAGAGAVTGRIGRPGVVVAAGGLLALVVAELLYTSAPNPADVLFGVGSTSIGAGMVLAGVGAWRTRPRPGVSRLLPVLIGAWLLLPVTVGLAVTGGPPHPVALLALAGWDVLWVITGLGILRMTVSTTQAQPRTAASAFPGASSRAR